MLRLMRFKGDGFYILPQDESIKEPLFSLWVKEIDEDGEYVEIEVKGSDNDRVVTLFNEVTICDGLTMYLDEIFKFRNKLSVAILFDLEYRILRHEILRKNNYKQVKKKQAGNK